MIINDGFYLNGFTRLDKGEAGAVFVHYEDEQESSIAPEIKGVRLAHSVPYSENYMISIPKPKARKVAACAIVTRTSKNCYQATAYDEQRIETFRADSLDGLRRTVAEFFEAVAV